MSYISDVNSPPPSKFVNKTVYTCTIPSGYFFLEVDPIIVGSVTVSDGAEFYVL